MTQDSNLQFNSELDQKCKESVCFWSDNGESTHRYKSVLSVCYHSSCVLVNSTLVRVCVRVCVCVYLCVSAVQMRCWWKRSVGVVSAGHTASVRLSISAFDRFLCCLSFLWLLLHTHTGDVFLSCSLVWFPDETLRRLNCWQSSFLW